MTTDRMREKAREIVVVWRRAGLILPHSSLPVYVSLLANDLADARREALEEAAQYAQTYVGSDVADGIRALEDKP